MKSITVVLTAIALFTISSCSRRLERENMAPVLIRILADISIEVDETATISMKHVEAYDDDGDDMSIIVYNGPNYTTAGTVITPTAGFVGDLMVPVQISDGILLSEIDTIIVSVVEQVTIMPLFTGAWWSYDDSVYSETDVLSSRLVVGDSIKEVMQGDTVSAFLLTWSNLKEFGMELLMSNDSTGTILHGGISPSDTLLSPQLLYKYPAVLGESWNYTPVTYNGTDSAFERTNTPQTITCTDTSAYISVPAGTFECVEMSYSYAYSASRAAHPVSSGYMGNRSLGGLRNIRANSVVTEKFYYCAGVGNVQSVTLIDDVVIWKKVLTDYFVEEIE